MGPMDWGNDLLHPTRPKIAPSVRFLINGLGHMGMRSLLSVICLRDHFYENGIMAEIVGLVDLDDRPMNNARAVCESLSMQPVYASSLRQAAEELRVNGIDTSGIIFYDASPTRYHVTNLPLAAEFGMIYFGEKPLITHREQLNALSPYNFFCDFIDTENVAFRTLREFIRANQIEITSLRCWRHGSTGFKALRGERRGVEGGALLDKSPHDISLTVSLLGLHNIESWEITVPLCGGGCLVLSDLESINGDPATFMSVTSREALREIGEEVADATFEMKIDWRLGNGRTVPAEYSFSWVGVLPSLHEALAPLGLTAEEWLGHEVIEAENSKVGYRLEEARICLVEGRNVSGSFTLVASFLPKLGHAPSTWKITRGQPESLTPLRLRFGQNSLTRVFKRVVGNVLYDRPCEIDRAHANLVHRVILETRTAAFAETIDRASVLQRSREAFQRNLLL